jgi:predicted O-methyltransferase YrrM
MMIDPQQWRAVDEFLVDTLIESDATLDAALAAQEQAGLPAIEVTPLAGKFLNLLIRLGGFNRVLEIGTLGGYSTIWMARAVGEHGLVTTIEAEPRNAEIARANFEQAGVSAQVELLEGFAADLLPTLSGPYDMVFIDADKESNVFYLNEAARLGRPGTLVVVDNIARSGRVADPDSDDTSVIGTRAGLALLGDDPRFDATALQTVGLKDWDGLAIAILR